MKHALLLSMCFAASCLSVANAQVSLKEVDQLKSRNREMLERVKSRHVKVDYAELMVNPHRYVNQKITIINAAVPEDAFIARQNYRWWTSRNFQSEYERHLKDAIVVYYPYLTKDKTARVIYYRKYAPNRRKPSVSTARTATGVLRKLSGGLLDMALMKIHYRDVKFHEDYYVLVDDLSQDAQWFKDADQAINK